MKNNAFPNGPIALDCEMVGVGAGFVNALGRVSIVDYNGNVLYDVFSLPDEPITDYRTPYSGIRPRDMVNALPFKVVRNDVMQIIRVICFRYLLNTFRIVLSWDIQ